MEISFYNLIGAFLLQFLLLISIKNNYLVNFPVKCIVYNITIHDKITLLKNNYRNCFSIKLYLLSKKTNDKSLSGW